MSDEDVVFQLLEEERRSRVEKISKTKKITVEDCLVIGILRLNKEVSKLNKEVSRLNGEISGLREEVLKLNKEVSGLRNEVSSLRDMIFRNFRWTVGLILSMWATIMASLIPILLRLIGVI